MLELLDGRGLRPRRPRALHADPQRRLPRRRRLPGDQHPPLVPAGLRRRRPLPPRAGARREGHRRHGALRHRGARRRADHRAGRRARDPPRGRRARSRASGATSSAPCSPARWACIWRTGFSSTRTGPSCSKRRRPSRARGLDERGDVLGELAAQVLLAQVAVLVELRVGLHDRQLAVDDLGADGAEHLADLRLGPHRAEEAGAGADDGRGLAAQDAVGHRARGPVERVLEHARDRVVVLGGRDQDGVGALDGVLERDDTAGRGARARPRRRRRAGSSRRPSNSSSSTPGGSSSAAARRSAVLCESLRRLPEMPRIRIPPTPPGGRTRGGRPA